MAKEIRPEGRVPAFTEDCKCSTSMTARVDVTELVKCSKDSVTKFYINFLYILSKVLNSRDDYRMTYIREGGRTVGSGRVASIIE